MSNKPEIFAAEPNEATRRTDAELKRLRDAVEWACGVLERSHDNPYMQPDIVAEELRRRAKG